MDSEQSRILRICYNYSHSDAEQEDLFQEVMLNLWKSFDTFRGESSRSTWVYRIALYTCMAYYRKKKRREKTLHESAREGVSSPGEDGTRNEFLTKALSQLNEIDRAIIILWLEERSYAEIASIIGISESNVGVRISRVKQKLIKYKEQYGYG